MNNSEKILSAFAEKTFFKEFVIDDLCFTPENESEIELADLLINLKDYIIAIQLKSRNPEDQTNDLITENQWLSKKCKNAKKQVKKTLELISSGNLPEFQNKRGQSINLREDADVIPLVVFENEKINSYPHLLRKHSVAGMDINCMSYQDFKEMCQILVTPYEIVLYLDYRKQFFEKHGEVDIYISDMPKGLLFSKPSNKESLARHFLLEKYGPKTLAHQRKYLHKFNRFMHSLPSHTVASSIQDGSYSVLLFLASLDRDEICKFIKRMYLTRLKARYTSGVVYSMRRADNEYAILFVAGTIYSFDKLMHSVPDVKILMEVAVYWETRTKYKIDFLLKL